MKTGRLLKFQRPGADVQAYLYQADGRFHASVFVLARSRASEEPIRTLIGDTEAAVEREVRAWVEEHFPARAR